MPLESANNFEQLDMTWPLSGGPLANTGGHLTQLKRVLKIVFKGVGDGFNIPITATEDQLDYTIGLTANVQASVYSILAKGCMVTTILPYSGLFSAIPTGWQLSDGTNGTINLTDKFIYGTNSDAEIGTTGGSANASVVSHNHTITHGHSATVTGEGDHTHDIDVNSSSSAPPAIIKPQYTKTDPVTNNVLTGANANHTHPITVDTVSLNTTSTGGSAANANNPAYIRLAYITRIS